GLFITFAGYISYDLDIPYVADFDRVSCVGVSEHHADNRDALTPGLTGVLLLTFLKIAIYEAIEKIIVNRQLEHGASRDLDYGAGHDARRVILSIKHVRVSFPILEDRLGVLNACLHVFFGKARVCLKQASDGKVLGKAL